jgi:protein-S-isoprenylcysteine O-methyltransferase Ste14
MPELSAVQNPPPTPSKAACAAKVVLQTGVTFAWFIGSLFVAAGRLDWIRGWIWVSSSVVCMTAVGLIVHRRNPGLLEARSKWRRQDTKRFDKIFIAAFMPLVLIHPAVAGLDVCRYHWTSMTFAFVYPGVLLLCGASAMITWVLVVNPFAESTVRIQSDREQIVITSGPYRFVRHPMYVGMIVMYVANSLILGSVWALVLSALLATLIIWRTTLEDRTLRDELAGYQNYAERTRYRLLPGVW